jgi:hypothetical protein
MMMRAAMRSTLSDDDRRDGAGWMKGLPPDVMQQP